MEPSRPDSTPKTAPKPYYADKKDGLAESGDIHSLPSAESSWLGWLIRKVFSPVTRLLYVTGIMKTPGQNLQQARTRLADSRPAAVSESTPKKLMKQPRPELQPLEEESRVSEVKSVGFAAGDKTGFVSASLKAVLAAYPDGYFDIHLLNEFNDPSREAVRQALLNLLEVSRGRKAGSDQAAKELKALYVACQDFYRAHHIDERPFSQMFSGTGDIENPVNAHVFISELLNILELDKIPQTTGKLVDYATVDEARWDAPLPDCLAHGVPLTPEKNKDLPGVPLALEIVPGDGSQTIQGCLDKIFAPVPATAETAHLKTDAQSLEEIGYQRGADQLLEDQLANLGTGEKLELPLKVARQPRLSVDLDRFRTFSVSLDVFNPEGTELALPEEAAAVTRDSGELITLPVTDQKTGQHYLIQMRQKSACVYDERTGQYKASIRDRQGWKCHHSEQVDEENYGSCWNIKNPHTAHVLFYERVGEPLPVPCADIVSLGQNRVDPEKLPAEQRQVALRVKEMTGRYPKVFRETDNDILLTDIALTSDPIPPRNPAASLFEVLSQETHCDKPLITDPAEFIALFSAVPANKRKNHQEIIIAMRFFRDFQEKYPGENVFPPASFAPLLMAGKLEPFRLDGLTDLPASARRALLDDGRRNMAENARKYVQDNVDLPVVDTMPATLQAAGIKVHGSGLWNFGNNCFMNAPLQMMAHSFKLAGNLGRLKNQPVPFSVAREMIERKFPRLSDEEQRAEGATQLRSDEIDAATREAMAGRGKYAVRVKGFKKFYAFRDSFVALMEALSDGQVHPGLPDMQREFYRAYLDISRDSNRYVAGMILGDMKPDDIVPGAMQQEDPSEFINDIFALLGLDRDPEACIVDVSTQRMIYKGQAVLERPPRVPEPLAIVPLAMTGVEAPTIPRLMARYCEEHDLPGDDQVNWTDADCNQAGVSLKDKGLLDTRQINQFTIMGERPPRRLMIAAKMFDYASEKYPVRKVMNEAGEIEDKFMEPGAFKPLHEGSALARNTQIAGTIQIPFIKPADATASMTKGQTLTEDYSIKSIVCHAGKSCRSGHYITIKFEKGETFICDDTTVVNLKDLARLQGRDKPYRDWHDYCARRGAQPYIFSLEASPPEYTPEAGQEADDEMYELAPEPAESHTPPPLSPAVTPVPDPALSEEGSDDGFLTAVPNSDDNLASLSEPGLETSPLPVEQTNPPVGAAAPVQIGPVTVVSGDICRLKDQWGITPDAVVNAANERLEEGSGVCGAIFRAAGTGAEMLQEECRKFGGCPPGEARTTGAYDLDSQWVDYIIHAVGPDMRNKVRYENNPGLAEKELKSAYQAALAEAQSRGMVKIAIPALSSGIFGFDGQRSVEIAADAIREYHAKYPEAPEVVFVLYHDGSDSGETVQGTQLRNSMEAALRLPKVPVAPIKVDMEQPPVLADHCLSLPENTTDPVAKMNYRLFKALNSVPLVEGVSDREGWSSWAWRMMMTYDQYTPPERLIHSESEFVRMFKSVPAKYRQKPDDMIPAVRRFKALRAKTPSITTGMFSYMLERGDLDPGRPLDDIDIDRIRGEADMPVVDPGLITRVPAKYFPGFDSGHVDSAMQCSLHLLAGAFKTKEQIGQASSQPVPTHVLRELVVAELTEAELAEGPELIDRRVHELLESRGRLAARRAKIERPYIKFQTDFARLMQEMTAPVPGDSLTFMYQNFLESYKALCAATGRTVPAIIRGGRDPALAQPSPRELMTQMMDLLGMHSNPVYALRVREHFSLGDDSTVKCQKPGAEFQGAALPLPLPSPADNSSLQSIVLDCADLAQMEKELSADVWTEKDRQSESISGQDIEELQTRRSVTFECLGNQPPEHLVMEFATPAPVGFSGSAMAENQTIQKVMSNTNLEVPVGIPVKTPKGQTAVVNYLVQDIVCKRVDSGDKAHYLTLQFRNGRACICDGSLVIDLKDYMAPNGKRAKYKSWMEFCKAENLQVCSFSLRRDPTSRGFENWHKDGDYQSEVVLGRNEYQARLNKIHEQRRLEAQALQQKKKRQAVTKAVKDPIQIELEQPEPTERTNKPGFDNLGGTCYAGSALVCLISGLSHGQLQAIEDSIPDMEFDEGRNLARGFLNLARAYKADASDAEIDRHLRKLFRACHYLGQVNQVANRQKLDDKIDRSEIFAEFFPSSTRFNAEVQDAADFMRELMEVLGLRRHPSCSLAMSYEFSANVEGSIVFRKPEIAPPQQTGIIQVTVTTADEQKAEVALGLESEIAAAQERLKTNTKSRSNLRAFLGKNNYQSVEDYLEKKKQLTPGTVPERGLQEFVDGLNSPSVLDDVHWELKDLQERGNYSELVARNKNVEQLFKEKGDGKMLAQDTLHNLVYSADLDQLQSVVMHYKIFDSTFNKRVKRCEALKPCYENNITITVRHTDGRDYDVELRPVAVSAHTGDRDVRSGHYIGYTREDAATDWTRHDDSRVARQGDLGSIKADPYLVHYHVVGKRLKESDQS